MNKMLFLSILSVALPLSAQDTPYKVNARLDFLPEFKLFAGNMMLSTVIGAALILAGTGLEELAATALPEKFVPIIDVPANIIAACGALTIGLTFAYNLIKFGQYWRKVGRAELEKLEKVQNAGTLAVTV